MVHVGKEEHKIYEHFSVKVIRKIEDFEQIKDTWNELAEKNDLYFPWLCHEWFNLFLRFFSDGSELFILILFRGSQAVAIAPFFLKKETFKGIVKVRKIELIGNVHSPVRNFIIKNSCERDRKDNLANIFRFFTDVYKDWDIIELERIPTENNNFGTVTGALSDTNLKYRTYLSSGNWHLNGINYSSEQYFSNQPREFQEQIENKKRRLQRKHEWKIHIYADDNVLDSRLDSYDQLRRKSWKAPEGDKTFVQEYTKLVCKKGWLRFAFLYADDIPIASQRWIVCQKKAYIWNLLYNQDYKKYSPGSILSSELCRYVIDEDKVNTIDYLTGDEPYKKFWTPIRRDRKGVTIFNNNVKGKIVAFLMLTLLPLFEKNTYLKSAKNRILSHLKRHHQ